jgi:histidine ammonia-lyase
MIATLIPGAVPLATWRDIAHDAGIRLDPAAAAAVEASAAVVAAIVARGEPAYGINTGFGRRPTSASVRMISSRSSAILSSRMRQGLDRQRRPPSCV